MIPESTWSRIKFLDETGNQIQGILSKRNFLASYDTRVRYSATQKYKFPSWIESSGARSSSSKVVFPIRRFFPESLRRLPSPGPDKNPFRVSALPLCGACSSLWLSRGRRVSTRCRRRKEARKEAKETVAATVLPRLFFPPGCQPRKSNANNVGNSDNTTARSGGRCSGIGKNRPRIIARMASMTLPFRDFFDNSKWNVFIATANQCLACFSRNLTRRYATNKRLASLIRSIFDCVPWISVPKF